LDTKPQEQPPTARNLDEEEQEMIVGDEAMSPSREVPAIATREEGTDTDKRLSHRPSIKEVDDEDSQEYQAKENKEKRAEASKEWLERQQAIDDEERQYCHKQAKERARQMWKVWKGPSQ